MSYTIYCGDNRDFYDRVTAVRAVITDPPYGEFSHHKDRVARRAGGEVNTVQIPFAKITEEDTSALGRFMARKCEGWALIFSEAEQISEWRSAVEDYERMRPRYFRPMIWVKTNAKPNLKGHGPGMGYETIQAYWCGSAKQHWNGGGKVGVFYHAVGHDKGDLKHPTGKPVSLMKELVRYFTDPGDTIFDPFMGCGATGVAALELGRKFIGIEKNEEYYAEAERRLQMAARPTLIVPEAKPQTLFGDSAFGSIGTRKRLEREAKEKAS